MSRKGQYYRLWELQQGNFAVDEDDYEGKTETVQMDIDVEDAIVYT